MTQGHPDGVDIEENLNVSEESSSAAGKADGDAPDEQKVSWLELFFDLIFVVAFDQLAKRLGTTPTAENIGVFLLMFTAVWWAWAGNTTFAGRYGNDGRAYRWGTVAQLVSMAMIALSLRGDVLDIGALFAAAFAFNRAVLVVMHLAVLRQSPEAAHFVRPTAIGFGVAALLWLVSALFAQTPAVLLGFWAAALAVDILTPILIRSRILDALPHQSHLPERVGLLQIIALGAIVTEVVDGGRQQDLTLTFLAPALFAILTTVALWRLYFDQPRLLPILSAHNESRVGALLVWLYGHLPFTLGVVMLGVGFGHGISQVGEKDAANLQLVAWPLAAVFMTLAAQRWNAARLTAHPPFDRSMITLLVGAVASAVLAFSGLETQPLHATVFGITGIAALIVATDPGTRRLGVIEEKRGGEQAPL
ncbi:low temperature requirement protein A [Deinococcus sp. QL22]|uniref:low temperature requirement protein A n=1 Tax=Deinococcus sp. QL22 TaxID=2939437 RepID=UPI0020180266|nr:low temperature requirement protein A [Deinococcus sp. QL22]UQN05616.1 low temperature requirement protein A [Deinococcus sp. QL22]